jgi:hypothetical protein
VQANKFNTSVLGCGLMSDSYIHFKLLVYVHVALLHPSFANGITRLVCNGYVCLSTVVELHLSQYNVNERELAWGGFSMSNRTEVLANIQHHYPQLLQSTNASLILVFERAKWES